MDIVALLTCKAEHHGESDTCSCTKGLVVKMAQTLWRASQDLCPSRYPEKICEGTGPEASRDRVGHFSPVVAFTSVG